MLSAWLLPEHIADVLPAQARHIEELRRALLDVTRSYGFELVMPPLLEHLESLLTGTGRELNLKTFKLVDQLSGRTLGVRADTTPQAARIDAHLLNRVGVTRLCYSGPVLHTKPSGFHSTREPLQFGAEIFGHSGLEADLEVLDVALDCLRRGGISKVILDIGDARIVRALLAGVMLDEQGIDAVVEALAGKDAVTLRSLCVDFPFESGSGLQTLLHLYGGMEVLDAAQRDLPTRPLIQDALRDLRWLADHVAQAHPQVRVGFDLADLGGYAYYSGTRFAVYAAGSNDALLRGGRYDEVGSVFGRNRPAVGFSMDIKELAALTPTHKQPAAIRAPWAEDTLLRSAVRSLREAGETVACVLPGHEHEAQEFDCDRELVQVADQWVLRGL